jgi:phosphate transport system permease protein
LSFLTDLQVQPSASPAERRSVLGGLQRSDTFFRYLTQSSAYFVLALLTAIFASLFAGGYLAFSTFGFGFLTTESWNPVTEKFGAVAPIYGTIVTSAIAMLIAVPISIGIAVFLTELCRSASPSSCSPAFRASSTASGACFSLLRSCSATCSPS